jgi:hypothetical protein
MLRRHLIATMMVLGALVGCSDSGLEPGQGRIALRLTDAPFALDSVESIDVFVLRIEAKAEATTDADAEASVQGASAGSDGWIVLATPNASFNLMDLQNGVSVSLGDAEVAAGSYRSLRLILDTNQSSVTLITGLTLTGTSTPSILFPSAGQSGIKVKFDTPIEVDEGATTDVLLDFDAGESFVVRGNTILQNGLLFKPVIRASVH